uniref:Uncharacterized protein n=1 Tax=Physcomitrium patens TaxID=3218 RepID=A0A7I4BV69_PHYPA
MQGVLEGARHDRFAKLALGSMNVIYFS